MAVISEEDCATEVNIRDNSEAVTTTLGLQRKSNEDAFIIPATAIPSDYPIAESYVLKMVPTVFDPLGLVSPFIIQGKIMLQEFWNWGYEWEEGDEDEKKNGLLQTELVFTAAMFKGGQSSLMPEKTAASEM